MEILFTYGTLMDGYYNHCLLANAKYLGKAILPGKLKMFTNGSFPIIKNAKAMRQIHGELYEVTRDHLDACDKLEIPHGYKRYKLVTVHQVTHASIAAFVYIYKRSELPFGFKPMKKGDFTTIMPPTGKVIEKAVPRYSLFRADDCESCAHYHKFAENEDGWWCGVYHKWDCTKGALGNIRDYSHKSRRDRK